MELRMIWGLRIVVLSDGFDKVTRLHFLRHVTQERNQLHLQDQDHTHLLNTQTHFSLPHHHYPLAPRSHRTPSLDQNPRLTQLTQKTSHNNQSNFHHHVSSTQKPSFLSRPAQLRKHNLVTVPTRGVKPCTTPQRSGPYPVIRHPSLFFAFRLSDTLNQSAYYLVPFSAR